MADGWPLALLARLFVGVLVCMWFSPRARAPSRRRVVVLPCCRVVVSSGVVGVVWKWRGGGRQGGFPRAVPRPGAQKAGAGRAEAGAGPSCCRVVGSCCRPIFDPFITLPLSLAR